MADALKDPFMSLNDMKGSFRALADVSNAPFTTSTPERLPTLTTKDQAASPSASHQVDPNGDAT